jgi:hypothetical protein
MRRNGIAVGRERELEQVASFLGPAGTANVLLLEVTARAAASR